MLHHLFPRKDGYTDQELYPYNPSEIAAYVFVAMFGIAGFAHIVLMFARRAWFFVPMIIGTANPAFYPIDTAHYGRRAMLAATIYMSLKRIANALDAADYVPISIRWMAKLFILFDVGCFVSQIAGSAMRANVETAQTGTTLVMAGLITQVVIFFIYISLMASVHVRLNQNPTDLSDHPALSWRKYMWSLYVISVLFLIRNLIRIIEFKQGDDGWLLSNEAPIYIFDGSFMLVIVITMAVVHPGRLARKASKMGTEGGLELKWRDSATEPFRPLASQA